jgi:hypothetical protein
MVLNGIGASQGHRPSGLSHSADERAPAAETRALVAVPDAEAVLPPAPLLRLPAAPFLAHLIATAHGEPQTRDRRRAEPGVAARAYALAANRAGGAISGRS